jgi:ABC-type amino acid transport substrate-binding protein
MADDTVSSQPADSGASLKKKGGKKNPMIIAAVVVIVVALIAVVVLGGFLGGDEYDNALDRIQSRGQLIVGTQVPYPPFENINPDTGELEGIDIEIMYYIGEELGVDIIFTPMAFDPLFAAVQTGQIDCAISSITITAERDLVNDFSIPYYVANQAVLVREDSTITDLDDLNSSNLVSQTGTTGQGWVDDNLSPSSHTPLDDVPAAVLGVENSLYDAFIVDTPVANKYANDSAYNLKVAFVIYTYESYGVLLPAGEPELQEAVNAAIQKMIDEGLMEDLFAEWLD